MNKIKVLYYGFFRKIGIINSMDVCQTKIDAKLVELNQGSDGPWVPIDDQSALMKTEFKNEKAVFNLGSALVVKVFMNLGTGEVKLFPLSIFKKD